VLRGLATAIRTPIGPVPTETRPHGNAADPLPSGTQAGTGFSPDPFEAQR